MTSIVLAFLVGAGLGAIGAWIFAQAQARRAQGEMSQTFKAVSLEALKSNNEAFLQLAKTSLEKYQETAKADLEKRQTAIAEIVKPVKETLSKFDEKIQDLEKARVGAYEGIKQQIVSLTESQQQLRSETANLGRALRSPSVRGRWGEIQLRRVVEIAGMVAHCDFTEQKSVTTEDGRQRPDLTVHLPGDKQIVVDAKVALSAYLEAIDATDDAQRALKLREHAQQIKTHLTALGRKAYWENLQPTPEFVVLFLPGEAFFSSALQQDPSLIELGASQNVILATPTTLIALLRAVQYGWRQEGLAENAKKISALGLDLYNRLATMGEHFSRVGKSLASTVDAYNSAVGSLETRVLTAARKFRELDASPSHEEITELNPVDAAPSRLQAEDLGGR